VRVLCAGIACVSARVATVTLFSESRLPDGWPQGRPDFSMEYEGAQYGGMGMTASFFTTDFSARYGESSLAVVILPAALGLWGFRGALGSEPLLNNARAS
jgi:hypothetical protein